MKLLITGAFSCTEEQKLNIESLGYEVLFHKMEDEPLSEEMYEVEAVICNGLFLYNDVDDFPNLRFVQLTSAGFDRVPYARMNERGIRLFNARGVYSVPMAEWTLTGVLSVYKQTNTFFENQREHQWIKGRNIKELSGSTVCIVGCGSVGTECAKRFKAFDTKIIGADIVKPKSELYDDFYLMESIDEAVKTADVVVLTLPLTDKTRGMFNKELFSKFKSDAILVNIARGAVVNEADLISALKENQLGGAVLDVFENEPLNVDSPLWDMKNVIVTPHNSFVGDGNKKRLWNVIFKKLEIMYEL